MPASARRHVLLVALALAPLLSPATPAQAADRFDLRAWLDRARTRVLVVEFYATHCKPCMDAVPQWKALHDKYRGDGLRLAVVSVQDQEYGCKQLPWNPDYNVCDDQGHIHGRFSPQRKLPMAFAWSWRGELIARSGHVGEVSRAVRRYPDTAQKVVVDGKDDGLRAEVQGQLAARGKLMVVLDEGERRRIRQLQKQSAGLRRAEGQCRVGKELSANMRLEVARRDFAGKPRLYLTLQSIERGCVVQTATAAWDRRDPAGSVTEAVDALIDKLRTPPQLPGGGARQPRPTTREPDDRPGEEWSPDAQELAMVSFTSEPPGAVLMIDGKLVCPQTPCKKAVAPGRHRASRPPPGRKSRPAPERPDSPQ